MTDTAPVPFTAAPEAEHGPMRREASNAVGMAVPVSAQSVHRAPAASEIVGATSEGMTMDEMIEDDAPSAYKVTAGELRQFIERWERLDEEKKQIAEHQKEVMAEAKARGYDTAAIRKLIALRKKDPADVSEEEAILEVYKEALGMD